MRPKHPRMLAPVAAVLLAFTPAAGSHDPTMPRLAIEYLNSGDYVVAQIEASQGGVLEVRLVTDATFASSLAVMDWTIFEDGSYSTGLLRARSQRMTRVATPAGVIVEDQPTYEVSGYAINQWRYSQLRAGIITLVIGNVSVGGHVWSELQIFGEGIQLSSLRSGVGTFHVTDEGFAEGSQARAPAGLLEIAANTSVTVSTEGNLLAWFISDHQAAVVSYTGPGKDAAEASVESAAWILLEGAPPGEHSFTLAAAAGAVETGWDLVGIDLAD